MTTLASDGIDAARLYQDWILYRARNPSYAGAIAGGLRGVSENRACGDMVMAWVSVQDGVVVDARHETEGCAICQASADLIAGLLVGETVTSEGLNAGRFGTLWSEALDCFERGEAPTDGGSDEAMLKGIFAGLAAYRSRRRCATLPHEAYQIALRHAVSR